MADFEIDVGFNTRGFEAVAGRGGRGPDAGINRQQAGTGLGENIAGGFSKAIKATGVLAVLGNLKVITDTLQILLSIMNIGIILYLKFLYEVFKDPGRGLLSFAVTLVNLFLVGMQKLLSLIPGFGSIISEKIPLFRKDILTEDLDAGVNLSKALKNSFLTEEAYLEEKNARAKAAAIAQLKAYAAQLFEDKARKELAEDLTEDLRMSLGPALTDANSAMLEFLKNFQKAANDANKELTGKIARTVTQRGLVSTADPLSQATAADRVLRRTSVPVDARATKANEYLRGLLQ